MADGFRHADQHEPERGSGQPRLRTARRRARPETPGASERRRQQGTVLERCVSDGDARRGARRAERKTVAGPEALARYAVRQVEVLRRNRQDRPYSSPGRDAAYAGPGIVRV